MVEYLVTVAEALGYKKLDRLRKLDDNFSYRALEAILPASINETYAILFFPGMCFEITPFGMKLAISLDKEVFRLLNFPELTEKYLRQVFTGFELLVYKLCHIIFENQRPGYYWETEKTRSRFKRLQPVLTVADWSNYESIFDEIFFVRDAFAHSFVDLQRIKYNGVSLSQCFGRSFLGRTRMDARAGGARIFMEDLQILFDPIAKVFCEHQIKQIDSRKFEKLCDQLLAKRSLGPGP